MMCIFAAFRRLFGKKDLKKDPDTLDYIIECRSDTSEKTDELQLLEDNIIL